MIVKLDSHEAEICEQLRTILETLPPNAHILFTQVDPDAMGAALLLKAIVRHMSSRMLPIVYGGGVGHPQTRAIFERFGLANVMSPISEETLSVDAFVLVDSSVSNDPRVPLNLIGKTPIVFDHHSGDIKQGTDKLVCVDQQAGSTCTILAQLVKHLKLQLTPIEATVAALGIYTDTHGLTSAGSHDIEVYNFLVESADMSALRELVNYTMPRSYHDSLAQAIGTFELRDGLALASAGTVDVRDGDSIAMIADELLRREGVVTVVVWGLVGSKVRMSARSHSPSINLGEFLCERFGNGGSKRCPNGHSEGGSLLELNLGTWLIPATVPAVLSMVTVWMNEKCFE